MKNFKRFYLATLFLFFCCAYITAQSNYYAWVDFNLISTAPTYLMDTKITADEFGKIYYIGLDGRVLVYWKSGQYWQCDALSSSFLENQKAAVGSDIVYRNSSVFFVNKFGLVSRFYYNSGWQFEILCEQNPPITYQQSAISTDEFGKVYFIDSNGRVCFFYKSNNQWIYATLGNSVPTQRALPFSIIYKDLSVYYVNENADVSRFYYANGIWNHQVLNTSAPKVMNGTQLTADEYNKVYYVDINGIIRSFYKSGTTWYWGSLNENSVKVKANTGLYYFDKQIFYVGVDNNIYVNYWNECRWEWIRLNENTIPADYSYFTMSSNASYKNNLYFISNSDNRIHVLKPSITDSHPYVYLKGKKFISNNSEMNLKVINYIIDVNTNDNINYWVSPHIGYDNYPSNRNCTSKTQCLDQLRTHFQTIHDLGFNAIRIMGLNPKPDSLDPLVFYIKGIASDYATSWININVNQSFEPKFFSLINDVLTIANEKGLKVIFVTGSGGNKTDLSHEFYKEYLGRLGNHFKENTTIMAYDLYNEPANTSLSKEVICQSSKNWYNTLKSNDPNHLITIGNIGASDVFSWDPAILSVDFFSFHPYPFPSPLDSDPILDPRNRVFSEINWVANASKKINKPWIIGETGFNANIDGQTCNNPDWGTETDQDNYARATITQTKNCGGSGYSWWQYHDVFWDKIEYTYAVDDYLGLYSHTDVAKKIVTNQTFQNFNPASTCACTKPSNYYDYFNIENLSSHYHYSGTVRDYNNGNVPIEDAVIYGWDVNWENGVMTYSKTDGTFDLISAHPLFNVSITAINKNVISTTIPFPTVNGNSYFDLNDLNCTPVLLRKTNKNSDIHKSTHEIESKPEKEFLSLFPNPANNEINILALDFIKNICVFDLTGQIVYSQSLINQTNTKVDCTNIPDGIYIVKVELQSSIMYRKVHILK